MLWALGRFVAKFVQFVGDVGGHEYLEIAFVVVLPVEFYTAVEATGPVCFDSVVFL
jgi:hypothetical protein